VGTGNVNILTFTTLNNATSEPASTAKGTTAQQYGRRLAQAAGTPSGGTIPAVSVVFQVLSPPPTHLPLLVFQVPSYTLPVSTYALASCVCTRCFCWCISFGDSSSGFFRATGLRTNVGYGTRFCPPPFFYPSTKRERHQCFTSAAAKFKCKS